MVVPSTVKLPAILTWVFDAPIVKSLLPTPSNIVLSPAVKSISVKPVRVVSVPPNEIVLLPIVNDEFANLALVTFAFNIFAVVTAFAAILAVVTANPLIFADVTAFVASLSATIPAFFNLNALELISIVLSSTCTAKSRFLFAVSAVTTIPLSELLATKLVSISP